MADIPQGQRNLHSVPLEFAPQNEDEDLLNFPLSPIWQLPGPLKHTAPLKQGGLNYVHKAYKPSAPRQFFYRA